MRERKLFHGILVVVLAALVCVVAEQPPGLAAPQQPPPTFRSAVTAVPVDVRVIDRDGKSVTDLKREDFTVFEDNVRQTIEHFSLQVLVPETPGPALRAGSEISLPVASPEHQRIFLIVLGGGALATRPRGPGTALDPAPARPLEGLLHLVRDRLLPQDQVALLAYNRATDFSADHQAAADVLEAFRTSEALGLAALGRMSDPASVQSHAESVFEAADPGQTSTQAEVGFGEYVRAGSGRMSDIENLYFGIKYLRFMPGEKHLIYLTAQGIVQPVPSSLESFVAKPWENLGELAKAASNARVALHTIQTGGIPGDPGTFLPGVPVLTPFIILPGRAYFGMGGSDATPEEPRAGSGGGSAPPMPGYDRPRLDPGVPLPGVNALGMEAWQGLRTLSARTGGRAAIATDASDAVDRIDAETRDRYLLAYYPSHMIGDGRFRAIRVVVNRPGVTVRVRSGYYAVQQAAALSPRVAVADSRLIAAASSTRQLRDIHLSASYTFAKGTAGKGGDIVVQMVIDPARLVWDIDDLTRRVTSLDLAVFCAGSREKTVGQTRRSLNVALTEARYAQVVKAGLPYSVRIPVTEAPRFLKIVVYHYDANLAGSAVVTMTR